MRVNIKRTRPEGEVGMREILVKAFNFEKTEVKYFIVKAKIDDAAFHKVRKAMKENLFIPNASAFWFTTISKNSEEYAKGYLKAIHLN